MNRSLLTFLLVIINLNSFGQSQRKNNWCGNENIMQELFKNNPGLEQSFSNELQDFNLYNSQNSASRQTPIIIPTVIHVFHYNGTGNISDEQVFDGLRMINEDFKRINADTSITRNAFKPHAGGMDIEFRLAKKDPQGNCTNGIVRVNSISTNNFSSFDAQTSVWPNDEYFNIWIVNDIYNWIGGGVILGYAYYPSNNPNPNYGLVNRNDAWGSMGTVLYFGRTPTHEVGHAFNLPHTFDGASCGANGPCDQSGDYVCDTPPTSGPGSGCVYSKNTCNSDTIGPDPFTQDMPDQIENYMSYDDCQNMFSNGQVTRMENAVSFYSNLSNLSSPGNLVLTGTNDAYFFTAPKCIPEPEFSANNDIICEGQDILFSEHAFNAPKDSTFQWNWTFPGGTPSSSTLANPTITYNQSGNYNVGLTVSNSSGTSTQLVKSNYIYISPPSGNFIAPAIESFSSASFPTNSDSSLNWQIESPSSSSTQWERNNAAFFKGPSSLKLDNFNILTEEFHSIISPVCDLSQLNSAYLNFWLAYARKAQEIELLNIYVSYNCGRSWYLLKSELSTNLYSTSPKPNSPFTPSSANDWRLYTLNINNLAGQDDLKFKIEFKSIGGNNIYIDEFQITESPVSSLSPMDVSISRTLYPNPSNGIMSIKNNDFKNYQIVNSLGIVMKKGKIGRENIVNFEFQDLSNGQYIMILESQNGFFEHHKLLISK